MKAMQNEHKADRGERAEKRNEFQMIYPDIFVADIVVRVYGCAVIADSVHEARGKAASCDVQPPLKWWLG